MQEIIGSIFQPATYGALLAFAFVFVCMSIVFCWLVRRRKFGALDSVALLCFDVNKRFVHIVGAQTYLRDDAPALYIFHHRLLDRETKKIFDGGWQRGGRVEANSDFLRRTTLALEESVKHKLQIVENGSFALGARSDADSRRPLCLQLQNTERDFPALASAASIIFRERESDSDSERENFDIEIYGHDRRTGFRTLSGNISGFRGLYDEESNELFFTFGYGTFRRIALCAVDLNCASINYQILIKPNATPF